MAYSDFSDEELEGKRANAHASFQWWKDKRDEHQLALGTAQRTMDDYLDSLVAIEKEQLSRVIR